MSTQVGNLAEKQSPEANRNNNPNHPDWKAVKSELQQMLDSKVINQTQLSKESNVNNSALNQFLKGGYKGRSDVIHERLKNWLDTHQRRVIHQQEIPDGPGFVLTPTSEKIIDTLTYAHMAPDIALIYGGSGVGKTSTFREYARNNSGVCIATMTPCHATVNKALLEISKCVGVQPHRDSAALYDNLCQTLQERRALLIIDEAQNLGNKALDQIRQIHDRIECGIVFAGNDQVYTNMSGRRAEYLDRVYSRVGMKTRINSPSRPDTKRVIKAWKITDEISEKLLISISEKPGGLRVVTKVLKLAHMIADDDKVEAKHIRAAWKRLSEDLV